MRIRPDRAEQSAAIWKGRKAAFGAIGRISDYYCMDGTIPLGKLARGAGRRSRRSATSTACKVANIFHAGDGNLHPLILYDANDADAGASGPSRRAPRSSKLCVAVGGCLTGEHGVGIEKRDLMRRAVHRDRPRRADAHQDACSTRKWLLNPAKVFPLDGAASVERPAADAGGLRRSRCERSRNMRPVDEREFSQS